MVAKNTSVIVKRIPPMRGRPGLLSKIKTLIPVAGQQKTTTYGVPIVALYHLCLVGYVYDDESVR